MRSFRVGDTHMLTLAGELDHSTSAEVERELRRIELTCARVIAVDLHELTFIDSAGVRLIVQAERRSCEGSNRLILVRGTDAIQRLFEICDVARTLPFVDRLPSRAAASRPNTTVTEWIGMSAESSPDATRYRISRRVSQAALAATVRELRSQRSHRRSSEPRSVRR
jgi:anti-anti-sigma factor